MVDNHYRQSYETCDIVDYTWSLSYLLNITGSTGYADRIERCVFNAGLGSVTEDFRALQYFSTANQLVLDGFSDHNSFQRGSGWMRYSPSPGTACCPGNLNRLIPNFVANTWRVEGDRVYSQLFGSCELEAQAGLGSVRIKESTSYPYETKIKYEIVTDTAFKLFIRRPHWAEDVTLSVNGSPVSRYEDNGYIILSVSENCTVELDLECSVVEHRVRGGVYLSRGPLVYSFAPEAEVVKRPIEGRDESFPEYDMYVSGEWRYALVGDYTFREGESPSPFTKIGMPTITAKARKIQNWELERHNDIRRYNVQRERKYTLLRGSFVFTPPLLPNSRLSLSDKVEERSPSTPTGRVKSA